MNVFNRFLPSLLLLLISSMANAQIPVRITTNLGNIDLLLHDDKAPKSVENFLQYVDDGFYEGTIFHRVIQGFMLQGGGFTADLQQKSTRGPVVNEANNGLSNTRGTVAMARTNDPHSATAQFFINHIDNPYLDHRGETVRGWGYTVFATVTAGMDVVDAMAEVPTGPAGRFRSDVPTETITILKVERLPLEDVSADSPAEPTPAP